MTDLQAYYDDCPQFNIPTLRENDITRRINVTITEMLHYLCDIEYGLAEYGNDQDREVLYSDSEFVNVEARRQELLAMVNTLSGWLNRFDVPVATPTEF